MKNKSIYIVMAVVFVAIMMIPHAVPNADGDTDYAWSLVPAAKGDIVDAYRGFVYPLVLKVFAYIWGWMLAGRLISALAMVGSIWFIFQVAGWPGVGLMLVSPVTWFAGYHLTTDALAWCFMCWSYATWCKWEYSWVIDTPLVKIEDTYKAVRVKNYQNWYMVLSGLLAGLAFCTKYPMLILLTLGLFIPWKKMWLFFTPALTLIGIQGILGNNWEMNVMRKGAGLDFDILKNMVMFPLNFSMDTFPLFPIIVLLAFIELVRRKRWELVIIGFGLIAGVSLTFYSARFFLPVMLPVAIGGNLFLRRYTNG